MVNPLLHTFFFFTDDYLNSSSRSFDGYSSVNYVLSEVRDPVRTIKRAAPLGLISVTVVYLFINISYFAVVSKKDILESQRIVALVMAQGLCHQIFCSIAFFVLFCRALYFRNLFGPTTEQVGLSCILSSVESLMPYAP